MEVSLRDRLKEFNDFEKDLQRIAIRRFFAVLEEISKKRYRGVVNILRLYGFEKEDLIRFIKTFEEFKDINWIKRELDGKEE